MQVFDNAMEAAFASAALHWSTSAGSSISGAFDWAISHDAVTPYTTDMAPLNECNGVNEILPVLETDLAAACANLGAGGGTPLACTARFSDEAGDPCDIIESDIYVNVDVMFDAYATPTYLALPTTITTTTFSVEQLLLHELGHLLGIRDDDQGSSPERIRLMDRAYPHGGDPGGDGSDPAAARSVRINTAEFKVLSTIKPLANATYDNLMLYKFERDTDSRAREVWLDPPPPTEAWAACRCECLTIDAPPGPGPIQAVANTLGTGMTAEVRWYLYEPTIDATCADGMLMDNPWTAAPDVEGVQAVPPGGGTMDPAEEFFVGQFTKLCVPATAVVGDDYKVCATITALSGGTDSLAEDSVVFSDAPFEVVDAPNCAGGPGVVTVCPP